MADILLFTPKKELDSLENLEGFIAMCRDRLTVFGADLVFDEMVWDVTKSCARKGQGSKSERITFCTLETAGKKASVPMCSAFRPFAQAYIRYMQGMQPVVGLGFRIAALRALEGALTENDEDLSPVMADSGIFNRAGQLIKARFSAGAAYRIGGQLQMVAEFLSTSRLTVVPLRWVNCLKRPEEGSRVGKEFDERRASKLPSLAALEALPKVYRLATEPAHILVSSIAAILCSAPDRINELLSLPLACEVIQPWKGHDEEAYGLRWWPAKGAEPMVKWVIPSMSSVVQEAMGKIRKCTDGARQIALWYEANPKRMYLPEPLEHLRTTELLLMKEVGAVLWAGTAARTASRAWCTDNGVPLVKRGRVLFAHFSDVERIVVAMLPPNFPTFERERETKYSDALCIAPRNLFHQEKATYACMIEPIVIQHVNDGLGARSEHGSQSIFDAMDFSDDEGNPICITTHQFRHYLNTLAQARGLSPLDIAKWSGRKDIQQNAADDHVTADELIEKIRAVVGNEDRMLGPLATIPKNILIPRDEFARMKIPTAHTTDYGFCVHDYTMAPCQLHRDCINCEEQVCIKGDEKKLASVRSGLTEARRLLADAEDAVQKGLFGGGRWLEHHQISTNRLGKLCEILEDPDIPVGAVIQLSDLQMPSQITQAEEQRLALSASRLSNDDADADADADEENDSSSLDLLRDLMMD